MVGIYHVRGIQYSDHKLDYNNIIDTSLIIGMKSICTGSKQSNVYRKDANRRSRYKCIIRLL